MNLSIIIAAAQNGVISANGSIPWRLPDDMRYFRQVTTPHPVIMGRITYESIPDKYRPLKGRANIVVSRYINRSYPGCRVVVSPAAAVTAAHRSPSCDEVFVAGGGQIYAQLLPLAKRIYLTRVETECAGDIFFNFDSHGWRQISAKHHPADERHRYAFRWEVYERI